MHVVLAAHGSADLRYSPVIDAIATAVAAELTARMSEPTEVRVGYLDHCGPRLADLAEPKDVVVPLLLSTGYHVTTDIPAAARSGVVTPPLGPDARLARACAERLRDAGWARGPQPVMLAAAGSSDPQGRRDVETVAGWLAAELDTEVRPAYLSAAEPRVAEVAGQVSAVATYLVAPGHFADQVAGCAAPVIAPPLADHPALVEIVADRAMSAMVGHACSTDDDPSGRRGHHPHL